MNYRHRDRATDLCECGHDRETHEEWKDFEVVETVCQVQMCSCLYFRGHDD